MADKQEVVVSGLKMMLGEQSNKVSEGDFKLRFHDSKKIMINCFQ